MAMKNQERTDASRDGGWRARVQAQMVASAVSIAGEASNVPNHANRVALSKNVLNSQDYYAEVFALPVLTSGNLITKDAPIATTISDAEIASGVESVWNGIAGVS